MGWNMNTLHQTAVLAGFLVASRVVSAENAPTVDLGYAIYTGNSNTTIGVNSFYGIRYAAPPTGDLRWKAPVPITQANMYGSNDSIDATSCGPQCVQATPGWQPSIGPIPASEDCLLLNVWTPTVPAKALLPVVVNIHGGGYISGNATTEPGEAFVSHSNGSVIYIAAQYRLGAYGFLPGSAVADDGVLNAGLLDQRLALEWVQEHARAFGGDSKQVTVWGGSAGGGSVLYQLTRGGGEAHPPFRSAIPEYLGLPPHKNTTTQGAIYETLLNAAGCASLECLRQLSYEALSSATNQSYYDAFDAGVYGHGDYCYTPVVDGSFVQDLPSKQLAAGNYSRVPILVDTDEFEGVGFVNFSVKTNDDIKAEYAQFWPAATEDLLDHLLELYPRSDYGANYIASNNFFQSPIFSFLKALAASSDVNLTTESVAYYQNQAIFGDYVIHCPSRYVASAAFNQSPKVPIWKLRFNAGYFAHAATRPYVLGDVGDPLVFNATLATIMKDFFLSFVVNQDPNLPLPTRPVSDRPWFPQYGAESTVLHVNESVISYIADPDSSARCDFFAANADVLRN